MSAALAALIAREAPRLLALPGVSGVGEGRHDGAPCLVVYLTGEASGTGIPAMIEGCPVIIERGGPFMALDHPGPVR